MGQPEYNHSAAYAPHHSRMSKNNGNLLLLHRMKASKNNDVKAIARAGKVLRQQDWQYDPKHGFGAVQVSTIDSNPVANGKNVLDIIEDPKAELIPIPESLAEVPVKTFQKDMFEDKWEATGQGVAIMQILPPGEYIGVGGTTEAAQDTPFYKIPSQ